VWEKQSLPASMWPYMGLLTLQPTYKSATKFFNEFNQKLFSFGRMVLEWRERDHEKVDAALEIYAGAQLALKRCGIYKFWALKGMRAQVRLLQMLVNYWDMETEAFNLNGKPLRIEVDDICFIIGLSHQGKVVNLKARGVGGGMNIEDYITTHCVAGTDKVGSQLTIRLIENLSLKIVVLILTQISGLASLNQASRPLMFYAVECLRAMVYDWCTSLLANMKSQLMNCKQGIKRNFGFASILCIFFL
jgi:hypothetical protein